MQASSSQNGNLPSEIIIAKAGKPIARLTPISAPIRKKHLGLLKGKIKVPAGR
jgi:antitoxin (DNA-binding transcriptional repressor) of toxin-antitoxin stability system